MAIVQSALAAFAESYQQAWKNQVDLAEKERAANFRDDHLAELRRQFNVNEARQGFQFGTTDARLKAYDTIRNSGLTQAQEILASDQEEKVRQRNARGEAVGGYDGEVARLRALYKAEGEMIDRSTAMGADNYARRLATGGDYNGANAEWQRIGWKTSAGLDSRGVPVYFGSDGNITGRIATGPGVLPYTPPDPYYTPTSAPGMAVNPSRFGSAYESAPVPSSAAPMMELPESPVDPYAGTREDWASLPPYAGTGKDPASLTPYIAPSRNADVIRQRNAERRGEQLLRDAYPATAPDPYAGTWEDWGSLPPYAGTWEAPASSTPYIAPSRNADVIRRPGWNRRPANPY